MQPKKSLRRIFSALLILSISSCAKVEIPDLEFCADMGELGATCFTTLSGKERDIAKAQWDKDRFGQVCTPSESFAKIKATILKFCEANKKRCEMEAVKQAEDFDSKVQKSVKKNSKG